MQYKHFFLKVITRVPKATQDEMEAAVTAAKEAFRTWSKTSVLSRQQVMFKYQQIIKDNMVTYNFNCPHDFSRYTWMQ